MADGVHITVKLEHQRELYGLADIAALHEHPFTVQRLLEDLRAEPLRDERDLKVAAVAIVRLGTEIHDAVRIKRAGIAFRLKADAHRTRYGLRRGIGKRRCAINGIFRHLRGMDIFQVVFHFVAHITQTSISNEYRTS